MFEAISFVAACLSFPTIIFTVLLGFVLLYWSLVILGGLDLDLFHGDAGDVGDIGDIGHDVGDVGHDLHGGGHDLHDGGHDAHHDGDHGGLIHASGLGGVPITVSLSFLILFAWFFSVLGVGLGPSLLGGLAGGGLAATGVLCLSLLLSYGASRLAIRPLRKMFVVHTAIQRKSLVGKICTITTLSVDDKFGQAEVADGGAGLIIQVRARDASALKRDSKALIFDYDPKQEAFLVAAVDENLRELSDRLGDSQPGRQ